MPAPSSSPAIRGLPCFFLTSLIFLPDTIAARSPGADQRNGFTPCGRLIVGQAGRSFFVSFLRAPQMGATGKGSTPARGALTLHG